MSEEIRVGISPRVIAAGVHGKSVRLTLALMPTEGSSVSLADWPQAVEDLLGARPPWKIYLAVAQAPTTGTAAIGESRMRPTPPAALTADGTTTLQDVTVLCLNAPGAQPLAPPVTRLWQDTMLYSTAEGDGIWAAMRGVIRDTRDGPPVRPDAPPVAATRRADAALFYTALRARSVFWQQPIARPQAEDRVASDRACVVAALAAIAAEHDPAKQQELIKAKTDEIRTKIVDETVAKDAMDDGVRKALSDSLARAAVQASTRTRYLASTSLPEAVTALAGMASALPSQDSAGAVLAAAMRQDAATSDLAKQLRGLHGGFTAPDSSGPRDDGTPILAAGPDGSQVLDRMPPSAAARQMLFALRANPTLGRLFRFVVDIEVPVARYLEALGSPKPPNVEPCFHFLACDLGAPAAPVWTVTKARLAPGPGDTVTLTQVWPALREEMEIALNGDPDHAAAAMLTQSDGLVRLGQSTIKDDCVFRYDIVTVDAAFATDSDRRRANLRQNLVNSAQLQDPKQQPVGRDREPDPSVITRGLSVVDRWRQTAVVSEIVNSHDFVGGQDLCVDAEDLATGMAVHVCVPANAGRRPLTPAAKAKTWRNMMLRDVGYADPIERARGGFTIEQALKRLGLGQGEQRRALSDMGSVTVPSRSRKGGKVSENGKERDQYTIHVEEALVSWEGDPLGLACNRQAIEVVAGSDLAISRTYGLPSAPAGVLPWALRLGTPYRVGLGVIWLGGVSVPVEEAALSYEAGKDLALPALPPDFHPPQPERFIPALRFLRHEPVGTPVLLLPAWIALRRDKRVRQTGPKLILREPPRDGEPDIDAVSWRVIVPPQLSIDDATRHGVFDADSGPGGGNLPYDGLRNVDIDAPWGGFPVFGRPGSANSNAPPSSEPLQELQAGSTRRNGKPDRKPLPGGLSYPPDDPGEPVFRSRRPGSHRKVPYYPDPAAEELVIALRPAAATERTGVSEPTSCDDASMRLSRSPDPAPYFPGTNLVVPVRRNNADFRSALPVIIRFRRINDVRPAGPLTQESFRDRLAISYQRTSGMVPQLPPDVTSDSDAEVIVVTFHLWCGEHVAADCWFAPRAETLRNWFDLPETIAMCAGPAEALDTGKALAAIENQFCLTAGTFADALPPPEPQGHAWLAASGRPVLGAVITQVARYLARELRRKPVPQLAAVQTIEAIHAASTPAYAPAFGTPLADGKVLALTRYVPIATDSAQVDPRPALLHGWLESKPQRWPTKIPAGATGVLLAGTVLVDRDTTSHLAIVATCASPHGPLFDDAENRKRSVFERLLGIWPAASTADLLAAGEAIPADPQHRRHKTAGEIYGFDVAPGGQVTLRRGEVTLLQIDNYQEWIPGSNFAGLDTIDLVTEQLSALAAPSPPAPDNPSTAIRPDDAERIAALVPFQDGLARKLSLRIRSTARFLPLLEKIAYDPDTGLPPDNQVAPRSDPASAERPDAVIWLPATVEPAPPAIHAVFPAFAEAISCKPEVPEQVKLTRTAYVRVWLDRPWFSSGEDERLGVVLWPPRLFAAHPDDLALGKVARPDTEDPAPQPFMDLLRFDDDDLGPAGRFVTRFGADPIREATGPVGPFVPLAAFADLPQWLRKRATQPNDPPTFAAQLASLASPEDAQVGYVANVVMPMPVEKVSDPGKGALPATLTVDLVTYAPRFDPDTEKWFVDLCFDCDAIGAPVEPFVRLGLVRYQAHAVDDLRVSTPAVSWAQVMPPREADIWRHDGHVDVWLYGPALPRAVEAGIADPADAQPGLPVVRVALLQSSRTAAGLTVETLVGPPDTAWTTVPRTITSRGLAAIAGCWTTRLPLPAPPGGGAPAEPEYFVLIEETERFASTAGDAVVGEASQDAPATIARIESGPRFAARIAVPKAR